MHPGKISTRNTRTQLCCLSPHAWLRTNRAISSTEIFCPQSKRWILLLPRLSSFIRENASGSDTCISYTVLNAAACHKSLGLTSKLSSTKCGQAIPLGTTAHATRGHRVSTKENRCLAMSRQARHLGIAPLSKGGSTSPSCQAKSRQAAQLGIPRQWGDEGRKCLTKSVRETA